MDLGAPPLPESAPAPPADESARGSASPRMPQQTSTAPLETDRTGSTPEISDTGAALLHEKPADPASADGAVQESDADDVRNAF